MQSSNELKLTPILNEIYIREQIDTMEVFVVETTEKKHVSQLVSALSLSYPWNDAFSHLKRVRQEQRSDFVNYQIIVTKTSETSIDEIKSKLNKFNEIKMIEVPANAPLTRIQFENCRKLWPVNFHENKFISQCLKEDAFSANEKQKIANLVNELISISSQHGNIDAALAVNGAVIVSSALTDQKHPLRHAIMCLTDNVANDQLKQLNQEETKKRPLQEIPYLLTKCDIFVTSEPCVMCSMALVHSRCRRLFFMETSNSQCPPDKAITNFKLHLQKNLNHHFEAWKIQPCCRN